jgi:putative DNA primase/helicase
MNADRIGVALRGKRNGRGWLVRCPCSHHGKGRGDRSPSLSVAEGSDGQLLVHCFAGCDFQDVLDELEARGLVEGYKHVDQDERPAVYEEPSAEALVIWRAASPLPYSIAAEYLERRGIAAQPPSLRCRLGRPALVAAVQRPSDGKIIAIQQTRLTSTGEKAAVSPVRVTTGPLGNGAVRLGPAGDVLGLAEGVETAVSAMEMTSIPVWASLGAKRLHRVELPVCVKEVHIFIDNDEPGRSAARQTAEVHRNLGRRVVLRSPPDQCGDWNDFLNLIADRDGRELAGAA